MGDRERREQAGVLPRPAGQLGAHGLSRLAVFRRHCHSCRGDDHAGGPAGGICRQAGVWWAILLLLYLATLVVIHTKIVYPREMARMRFILGDEAFFLVYPEEKKKELKRREREKRRQERRVRR